MMVMLIELSFPTPLLFELFLCSSLVVTAVDDNDHDDDYANEYDLTPAVSLFIEYQNRFGPYQLVP